MPSIHKDSGIHRCTSRHLALIMVYQHNPKFSDGGSLAAFETMAWLQQQGNTVTLFTFINHDPEVAYVDRHLAQTAKEFCLEQRITPFSGESLGEYPHRAVLKLVCDTLRPHSIDFAVTIDADAISILAATLLGIPGAHFFHSLKNLEAYLGQPQYIGFLRKRKIIAASHFVQKKAEDLLGLKAHTWYGNTRLVAYGTGAHSGISKAVGYFSSGNHKGDDIVEAVTRKMPHRRFVVTGGRCTLWAQEKPDNVEYLGHIREMRHFYEKVGLLLVPSLVEEAFSRVILEAAVSGIPVIANNMGGIPEALGDSGILIDIETCGYDALETADRYVTEIDRLLEDEETYGAFSAKAVERARRFQREQSETKDNFMKVLFGPVPRIN